MKILIISPTYPPAAAGEAEHCYQIAERLAGGGHEVTVLTGRHPAPSAVRGFSLRALMPGWRWRHLLTLLWQVRSLRPDAVVLIYTARLFDGHPMITFMPTLLRRMLPSVRMMTLMEIYMLSPVGSVVVRAGRKALEFWVGRDGVDYCFGTLMRDSNIVAALGPTILASLTTHDASVAERALIIPPPPLVSRPQDSSARARKLTRQTLGAYNDMFLLAYFGYVYPGKGVETLLAALRCMVDSGYKVRLVMVGGGRDMASVSNGDRHDAFVVEMKDLAKSLGIGDLVVWPQGYVGGSDEAAADLLAADVAVLPFDDGAELRRSSIAVVASMGLPLVTTEPSVHEPAFVNECSALLCPPRDPEALAAAVCRVADDAELRQRLQAGALALARDWFSWDGAISKIAGALDL